MGRNAAAPQAFMANLHDGSRVEVIVVDHPDDFP
jgi:hypothetical protein